MCDLKMLIFNDKYLHFEGRVSSLISPITFYASSPPMGPWCTSTVQHCSIVISLSDVRLVDKAYKLSGVSEAGAKRRLHKERGTRVPEERGTTRATAAERASRGEFALAVLGSVIMGRGRGRRPRWPLRSSCSSTCASIAYKWSCRKRCFTCFTAVSKPLVDPPPPLDWPDRAGPIEESESARGATGG